MLPLFFVCMRFRTEMIRFQLNQCKGHALAKVFLACGECLTDKIYGDISIIITNKSCSESEITERNFSCSQNIFRILPNGNIQLKIFFIKISHIFRFNIH